MDVENIAGNFKIVNTSDKAVNILETRLSCGCADINLSEEVIPANDFIEIKLTVALEGKYGPNAFEALLFTDDPAVPIIPLRFIANIVVKNLDGTVMLNLGLFSPEEQIDRSFTILPGKVNAISVTDILYSSLFSAAPSLAISAIHSINQDVQLSVVGIAPSKCGEFSIELSLVGEGADWGEARVHIKGTVQPEISIPASVSIGFIEPGQSSKTVVKIAGLADFFSKHSIEKMIVTNQLPELLDVRFVDSPTPQLEFSLHHSGNAGSFSEVVEMEFIFSNERKSQLSTSIVARFL